MVRGTHLRSKNKLVVFLKLFDKILENGKMTIVLKPIDNHIDNINALFELIDKNRAYLKQFLGWLDYTKHPNDTKNHLNARLKSMQNHHNADYFITLNEMIVGMIDVRDITHHESLGLCGVVGYWIAQNYTNQGLTMQALQKLIAICQDRGINTLILRANPDNLASNKVAQKCGFVYQHTDKNAENLYGHWYDLNVYHLTLNKITHHQSRQGFDD